MNDDQLHDELERRSNAAPFRAEELLPDVRRGIGGRSARSPRFARWAPLAGLAAAAVIVLAIIVALPRSQSVPPASTPSPSAAAVHHALIDCGELPSQSDGLHSTTPVSVLDSAALISSCSSEMRQGSWPNGDSQAFAAAVAGDDAVEVAWHTQQCAPENVSIRVDRHDGAYAITVVLDRLSAGGATCVNVIASKHALLHSASASLPDLAAAPVSVAVLAPDEDARTRAAQIECSPEPGAAADQHSTLYDETGLVSSCGAVDPTAADPLTAANPDANRRVLDVNWSATPCESGPTIYVGKLPNGYFVHGALPKAPCSEPAVAHTLRINLNTDVAANDVIVQVDRDGPTTSGKPPVMVRCGDASDVTIVDVLGVVESCAATQKPGALEEGVAADNPGGDTNTLQLSWAGPGSPCDYEVHLTQPDEHYALNIYYGIDGSCSPTPVVRTVILQLARPIESNLIDGWSFGGPPRNPPPSAPATANAQVLPTLRPPSADPDQLFCGQTVTLIDYTGTVLGCIDRGAVDYRSHSQDPKVSTVAGDPTTLHLWWGQSYCVKSEQVSILNGGQSGSYAVNVRASSIDPACWEAPDARAIDVTLNSPVDPAAVSLTPLTGYVPCESAGDLDAKVAHVYVRDATGRVTSCSQYPAVSSATDTTGDSAENVAQDAIRVDWSGENLGSPAVSLNEVDGHYELASSGSCRQCSTKRFEIVVHFAAPLDVSSLWLGLDGKSPSAARTP
jgi:hypothetical protein